MGDINITDANTNRVPAIVATMAADLANRILEQEDNLLINSLRARETSDLQSQLEDWIIKQIDLDAPEIARAIYNIIARRAERELSAFQMHR